MNKKNNQRYQDNEEAIIDVFVELLKKKPIEKISVKDICEQSLVNRTTFYAHFQDIYELKEHTEVRFEEELLSALQEQINGEIDHRQLMRSVIHEIKKRKEYYRIYFSGLGYSRMHSGFQNLIEAGLQFRSEGVVSNLEGSDRFTKYQFAFFFEGMIAALAEWLKNDCDLSEDEIASLIFDYFPIKENISLPENQ